MICFLEMRYAHRVRPNCIQHNHVCAAQSAHSISIVRSAVAIIMVQSVPDYAVVRSAFSETQPKCVLKT